MDAKLAADVPSGQALIDCLTALRFAAPELNPVLHPRLISLVPAVISALSSSHAVLRCTAAKCLATLCDVITEDGMKVVVDTIVPLVGDAKRVPSRRGAVEAIHRGLSEPP